MNRQEFRKLAEEKIIVLDGATGSNLMKAGMPSGVCPEKWIIDNPDALINLQRSYVKAGSNIVLAPTFTGNRIKLEEYGLADRIVEINTRLVEISKEAVADKAYVAGDISMTGKSLEPVGDMAFEELVNVYKEQAKILYEAGVDLFIIETMMSLQECRAALLAVKETCDLPVIVSLTYNEDGTTLYGTTPDIAVIVLQSMGADAVGLNCSRGPRELVPLVREMAEYAYVPIIAKPNAGLPVLVNGESVYDCPPGEFVEGMKEIIDAGASIVGGCCGTNPEYIKELSSYCLDIKPRINNNNKRVVTSERGKCDINLNAPLTVVGERINPTGKKKLQEELRKGNIDIIIDFARQQEEDNARILDINMGTNGIDEKQMMLTAIEEVSLVTKLPLCIDTSFPEIMEAALRIYPGRALINSISCEKEKLEALLPIAKKYGAMFIALPLSDAGLPKSIDEKKANIKTIINKCKEYDIDTNNIIVDILVTTIGANPDAANECFEVIDYCYNELKFPTICGLSNISFGMPSRQFVNSAFLNIALSKGLTMAIANPSQELLMSNAYATDLLLNKEGASDIYLQYAPKNVSVSVNSNDNKASNPKGTVSDDIESIDLIMNAVVNGEKSKIVDLCRKEVENGKSPQEILDNSLIPGINKVGELYDSKKFFLPQLIAGADSMEKAMSYLEPLMVNADSKMKETIVMATVEGDIHDIGKNLVCVMLKNYGYNVIDLGKDVPAEDIVDTAIKENAAIIGLSALMTTTMMRMADVVKLRNDKSCSAKVIIGGACVTPSFANEIGADDYSSDAADCVRVVKNILAKK